MVDNKENKKFIERWSDKKSRLENKIYKDISKFLVSMRNRLIKLTSNMAFANNFNQQCTIVYRLAHF